MAAAGRDLPPLLLHESDQRSEAALQVSERTVVAPLLGQALDDHPAVLRIYRVNHAGAVVQAISDMGSLAGSRG